MTLPNFIIAGAGKSGTSSLWSTLRRHPQVFMAADKEPAFFLLDPESRSRHALGLEWYETLFSAATDERAIGEASVAYFSDSQCPRLLRETLGEPRLVFILRDPADRAYSSYLGMNRRGTALPYIDEVVRRQVPPFEEITRHSMYAANVRRFLEYHRRERMLFLRFDDLARDPQAVFETLCTFLGVDPALLPDRLGQAHNVAARPRSLLVARALNAIPFRKGLRSLLPHRLYNLGRQGLRIAKNSNLRPLQVEALRPETRQLLIAHLHDDICDLETLLGWDLQDWKTIGNAEPGS